MWACAPRDSESLRADQHSVVVVLYGRHCFLRLGLLSWRPLQLHEFPEFFSIRARLGIGVEVMGGGLAIFFRRGVLQETDGSLGAGYCGMPSVLWILRLCPMTPVPSMFAINKRLPDLTPNSALPFP